MANEHVTRQQKIEYSAEILHEIKGMLANQVTPAAMSALTLASDLIRDEAKVSRIKSYRQRHTLKQID